MVDNRDTPEEHADETECPGIGSDEQRRAPSDAAKGKAKEPTIIDRIISSGKEAAYSLTGTDTGLHGLPFNVDKNAPGSTVLSGGPSTASREAFPSRLALRGEGGNGGTFREPHRVRDTQASEFNGFLNGSQSLEFENRILDQTPLEPPSSHGVADGHAVIDLLNQPIQSDEKELHPDQDDTLHPEDAAKLQQALFGPSTDKTNYHWDDLLNLMPQFITDPTAGAADIHSYLGTRDATAARELWLNEWEDILSSYTNEVWGSLGPLAAEAKIEVEEALLSGESGESLPRGGALRRLKMILAHIRGSE